MSRHDALWADHLLVAVRQHADPTERDAERNLTALEQRLQLGAQPDAPPHAVRPDGASRVGDGAAAGTLLQLRPGGAPPAAAAGRMTSAASGWKSAAVLGRWLAFGAASALLGYLGGRFESRQELDRAQQPQTQPQPQPQLQTQPQPQPQTQPQPQPQTQPQTQPPPVRPRAARPRAAPAPPRIARRAALPRVAPEHAKSAANQQLRDAIELLQRAEAALRQGDAFAASLLLSDLDRSAPPALLREERLATSALVGCALGDESSAGTALRALEQLNPESIYRARLEGSCAEKKPKTLSKEPPAPH